MAKAEHSSFPAVPMRLSPLVNRSCRFLFQFYKIAPARQPRNPAPDTGLGTVHALERGLVVLLTLAREGYLSLSETVATK